MRRLTIHASPMQAQLIGGSDRFLQPATGGLNPVLFVICRSFKRELEIIQ